jgi:Glycoside hydrolase family 44
MAMSRRLCIFAVSLLAAAGIGSGPAANARTDSPQATTGPTLKVNVYTGRHAISRDVYGVNYASAALIKALRLPLVAWTGDTTTRYNYLLDTTNYGSDFYFENDPNPVADPAKLPAGSSADVFIAQNKKDGAATLMTVPMVGWTPDGRNMACGFSVAKYGAQQSVDPEHTDCGNGVLTGGMDVTGNFPADTSTPIGASFDEDWVKYLVRIYGTAAGGGVKFYDLDNEPDLWFETQRDVHPIGASYDEMLAKTEATAKAVKHADPSAQTLGPVGWGWTSLFYSGLDQQTCQVTTCGPVPPDMAAHGGVPFATWYLRKLAAYQHKTGVRLLDYFDNHWYPQESGVFGELDTPAEQALRLESTRMLWDPTYVDQSWIDQPVVAIPRMRKLVDTNYPGTKIAISEYSWGALDKIDGGLAEADVLGIFGKYGLNLAALWGQFAVTDPAAFAFRMYLNYDGKGSAFGNTSVSAASSNQADVSVYAAQRSRDHALTIIVINKTTGALSCPLSVKGLARSARAEVYQYGQADPSAIVKEPGQIFRRGRATVTLPGYSITEFVIPASGLTRHARALPAGGAMPAYTGLSVTPTAGPAHVPATSYGPPDAFLWATGYGGRKITGRQGPG